MARLALKNLLRHPTRTLLVALVVAYVVVANLFYLSVMDAYEESVRYAYARFIAAPVVVARTEWFEDPAPEHGIEDLEAVRAAVGDRLHTLRLGFSALAESPYQSEGVEATGVEPEAERRLSRVPGRVEKGRWLEGPGEVVLGHELAKRLDVRVGERLVLSAAHLAGPRSAGLRVVGLLRARVGAVDRYRLYLHLEDARRLTGLATATHLAVDAPRGREARVAGEIAARLPPGYAARDAWALVGPVKTDIELGRALARFYNLFLALLSALAVTSTLYVSVRERTRELGVIAALGLDPARLAGMVVLEGVFASLIGWTAGLLFGYGLLYYGSQHNLLGPIFALSNQIWPEAGLFEEVYLVVRAGYLGPTASVVAAAALLALLFPARYVYALDLPRALRFEV